MSVLPFDSSSCYSDHVYDFRPNCTSLSSKNHEKSTVEPRYNEVATHGLAKVFRYNEISLNRGIFPYVLLLLG